MSNYLINMLKHSKKIKKHLKDIDGRAFYINMLDPSVTFNRIEITLSHLFREKMSILNNRNYSDCLFEFLKKRNLIRPNILEVGGGLGYVASNLLKAAKKDNYMIDGYTMYDISHGLLKSQKEINRNLVSEYVLGDCLEIENIITNYNGMVLANGVIADLRSVYLSDEEKLKDYGINDLDLIDFSNEFADLNKGEGYYFHIGAILFIKEISKILEYGSTAVITEYFATEVNQPSLFGNHYECGIHFPQVAAYAERLGFEVQVADIEEVLDIPYDQKLLSVDCFTSQDKLVRRKPKIVNLWKGKNNLPVLAYTPESLKEMLISDYMGFSINEANELIDTLTPYFFSIHNPQFDNINPTTWGYKCLLLHKPSKRNWIEISEPFAASVISNMNGISVNDASQIFKKAATEKKLGDLSSLALDQGVGLLIGLCYSAVKRYGEKFYYKYLREQIIEMYEAGEITNKLFLALIKGIDKTFPPEAEGK